MTGSARFVHRHRLEQSVIRSDLIHKAPSMEIPAAESPLEAELEVALPRCLKLVDDCGSQFFVNTLFG
jgi:hypothetical protein